jgi:RNA polymerase sigma-70 factor (ECF subfamily)
MITRKVATLTLEQEKKLVLEAQNGSRKALERLIDAHYQQMYYLALKITRDTAWAEDVTQEACVQVLRRIDQFRSESRFCSWLCRIVVNTALLKHRREKRLVPTADIFSANTPTNDPLPDEVSMNRELLKKTEDFLSQLRDGDRDLFVKRFVEGLSLQNISDETGLSLPALKSRFHRARLRLKQVSEEQAWCISFRDDHPHTIR